MHAGVFLHVLVPRVRALAGLCLCHPAPVCAQAWRMGPKRTITFYMGRSPALLCADTTTRYSHNAPSLRPSSLQSTRNLIVYPCNLKRGFGWISNGKCDIERHVRHRPLVRPVCRFWGSLISCIYNRPRPCQNAKKKAEVLHGLLDIKPILHLPNSSMNTLPPQQAKHRLGSEPQEEHIVNRVQLFSFPCL
jgi:hypothetical protein